jgi:hypothetical protein
VSWHTPDTFRLVLRAYDKGQEIQDKALRVWRATRKDLRGPRPTQQHEAGTWLRVERQWYPPRREQLSPSELAESDLRERFQGVLKAWIGEGDARIRVADPSSAVLLVAEAARRGDLSRGKALGLMGALTAIGHLGEDFWLREGETGRRDLQRRKAELRSLGIALELPDQLLDQPAPICLDVGEQLAALSAVWSPPSRAANADAA